MRNEAEINAFRFFAFCMCCLGCVWIFLGVAVAVLIADSNTGDVHEHCVGLLDFVKISMITPVLFPAVYYCCASSFHHSAFSRVACASFFAVSVYMLVSFSSNALCLQALGDPPLLLYLLFFKAVLYGVGMITQPGRSPAET
jgi:hypothetical protein